MTLRARRLVAASPLLFSLTAACGDPVDLGNNSAAGAAGASAGASGAAGTASAGASGKGTSGSSSAGSSGKGGGSSGGSSGGSNSGGSNSGGSNSGGSSGGSNSGGSSGGSNSGGSGSAGKAGASAQPCPPSTLKGTLGTMLDPSTMTYFGPVVEDIRVGKNNVYVLSDPWVYFAFYSGAQPLTSTLPLNEHVRQLAVMNGTANIPASFQTSDKLLANFFTDNGETVFALKTKDDLLSSTGEGNPGLVADGTDVFWALHAPARVVEAELAPGGVERVLGDYPDATSIIPTALAVDANYIYWTTAKTTGTGFDSQGPNKLYRAGRHGASPAEELGTGTMLFPIDQILVDGDKLHLAYARGTSNDVGETRDLSGKLLSQWGSGGPVTFRISRMVVLDGQLYWTEHKNNACEGRLVRRDTAAVNKQLDLPEPLIENLNYPGNLAVNGGTLYFTTPTDTMGQGGALYSYVPSTPGLGCHGCGSIYAGGAVPPVCPSANAPYGGLISCALMSCFNQCNDAFLDPTKPFSAACKSCMAAPCASQITTCMANGDGLVGEHGRRGHGATLP